MKATSSGTFTVLVSDGGSGGVVGTGTYRLYFAKAPGAFVIPNNDDGGVLVPAGQYDGTVDLGDLDLWSFSANGGDDIVVQIMELTDDGNGFDPWIRLYGPDGKLLGSDSGSLAAEVAVKAPSSGTFTVLVSDGGSGGVVGTGTYRLTISGISSSPSPTRTATSIGTPSTNTPTPAVTPTAPTGMPTSTPTPTLIPAGTPTRSPSATPTGNLGTFAVTGTCLQPGTQGLVPCDAGTTITVSVCSTDLTCNPDTLTLLESTVVGDSGAFSFVLDTVRVRRRRLVFQAIFGQGLAHSHHAGGTAGQADDENQYRVLDFGPVGAGEHLDNVMIDPSSAAAVELMSENGLQNYSNDAIVRVTQSVRAATTSLTFAGLSPSEALMLAVETAQRDPAVQDALQQTRFECAGDCDGSGTLAIDELVTLVNIALGSSPLSSCLIGDADDSGQIAINELVLAVNAALDTCGYRAGTSS